MECKGLIGLDIDGTVAVKNQEITPEVVLYLSTLVESGWKIAFLTGRSFHQGLKALKAVGFPYILGAYNGAILVEMPSNQVLEVKTIAKSVLPDLYKIFQTAPTGFIAYTESLERERCFWSPTHFTPSLRDYIRERFYAVNENLEETPSFESLPFPSYIACKSFGPEPMIRVISEAVTQTLGLHAPFTFDRFDENKSLICITHPLATKGNALREIAEKFSVNGPLIGAGDDLNDKSLLQAAHIKVAMASSPQELLKMADVIAPPASENGIILGLKKAISFRKNKQEAETKLKKPIVEVGLLSPGEE